MIVGRERLPAPPGTGRQPFADLRVRPMRRRHLTGVLAIERRVYPRPWSPQIFEAELTRGSDRRYVVALGRECADRWTPRRVVGYGGVLVQVGEAHITTIAVDPSHHRRKVATHVLIALLDAARGLGAEAATLEARVANRGAQRLYSGFGFAPVGVRPGYYPETGEDALIMWAHELQSEEYGRRLDEQRRRASLPGGASGVADLHVPWVAGRIGLVPPPDLSRRDPPRRRDRHTPQGGA